MDLETIIQGLDYLSESANKSLIMMNNMIVLAIELLCAFAIRFLLLLKINLISPFKTDPSQRRQKTIIANHLGYEICLAVLISWLLMTVISSVQINYVVNLIISPIVGVLGGITIDNIYILPRRNKSLYSVQELKSNSSSNPDSNSPSEPITININTDPVAQEHISQLSSEHRLSESLAGQSNFDVEVIHFVNDLAQVVLDLRESEMIERKMWLKSEMYRCLGNGFATPAEHDKIRGNYHAYIHLLKGNGDVKNLYENHFSHLGVHEDRRKGQQHYEGEDRRINHNCEYGQFDSEYSSHSHSDTLNNCE